MRPERLGFLEKKPLSHVNVESQTELYFDPSRFGTQALACLKWHFFISVVYGKHTLPASFKPA